MCINTDCSIISSIMPYEFNVSLYKELPKGRNLLHNMINNCKYRLNLYSVLKENENINPETVQSLLETRNPLRRLLETDESPLMVEAREIDYITHWALRILYCNTHSDFFIKCEVKWFMLRFKTMLAEKRMAFLKEECAFKAPTVSQEELDRFDYPFPQDVTFYKMKFTEVLALVSKRLVILWHGYAYVPEKNLDVWAAQIFEKCLKDELRYCKKRLSEMKHQLATLIESISIVSPYPARSCGDLDLESLDAKSGHFPLCMRSLHETLRSKHHLKYNSRIQYGLFLKGLGLPLEDALKMWKGEFTERMTETQFERGYKYFFQHQYGLRGSKINYPAQSCDRIIMEAPAGIDHTHGCPFAHWDDGPLQQKCIREGISARDSDEILNLKNQEQYKTACTLFLRKSTGSDTELKNIINHPITYYETACARGCRQEDVSDIEDLFAE